MKMKRAAIVMILLALFAAPMALADSEEDAGTQAEMNAMATGLGAQVDRKSVV